MLGRERVPKVVARSDGRVPIAPNVWTRLAQAVTAYVVTFVLAALVTGTSWRHAAVAAVVAVVAPAATALVGRLGRASDRPADDGPPARPIRRRPVLGMLGVVGVIAVILALAGRRRRR